MEPTFVIMIADCCGIGTSYYDVLVIVGVCTAASYILR